MNWIKHAIISSSHVLTRTWLGVVGDLLGIEADPGLDGNIAENHNSHI